MCETTPNFGRTLHGPPPITSRRCGRRPGGPAAGRRPTSRGRGDPTTRSPSTRRPWPGASRLDVRRLLRGHQLRGRRRPLRRAGAQPLLRVPAGRQQGVHRTDRLDRPPRPPAPAPPPWSTTPSGSTSATAPTSSSPDQPGRRPYGVTNAGYNTGIAVETGRELRLLGLGAHRRDRRHAAHRRAADRRRRRTGRPGPGQRQRTTPGPSTPATLRRPPPATPAGSRYRPSGTGTLRLDDGLAVPAGHLQGPAERPAPRPRREDRRPEAGLRPLPRRLPGQHRQHVRLRRGQRLPARPVLPVEGHCRPGREPGHERQLLGLQPVLRPRLLRVLPVRRGHRRHAAAGGAGPGHRLRAEPGDRRRRAAAAAHPGHSRPDRVRQRPGHLDLGQAARRDGPPEAVRADARGGRQRGEPARRSTSRTSRSSATPSRRSTRASR